MAEPAEQEFLRTIFLMEAWDTVAALERAATTLATPGGVDDLFVVTHRLKGAASLHGFPDIAALAAEVEAALAAHPPETHVLTTLLGPLKRALDAAAAGLPAPPHAPEATPPAAVDHVRHIDVVSVPDTRAEVPGDPLRAELDAFFASNADVATYFIPEATEHLDSVTATLGALEHGGDADTLARLFRAVHTLKGAAYVVGCTRVGEVAHRMEDVLVAAREGSRPLTPSAVETLYAAEGVLRLMLGLAPDPRANITDVVIRIRVRLDALLAPSPTAEPAPTAATEAAAPAVAPPVAETTPLIISAAPAPASSAPPTEAAAVPALSPLAALLSAPRPATRRAEAR